MKKFITILLLVSLLIWQNAGTTLLYADTLTPTPTDTQVTPTATPSNNTPTPTPTPTPTIDPVTPTPIPIDTTTPTPTIASPITPTGDPSSISPTPVATTDASFSNSGLVNNAITSGGNSGDNTITASESADATPSATPQPGQSNASSTPEGNTSSNGSINTGTAAAGTAQDTSVNVNSINSQVVTQTINIFATQNGPIDLSAPGNIASDILLKDKNTDPVINVALLNNNNYAYVDTSISSAANSGDNSASTSGQFVINTGNAQSLVNLINKVNFTIVDSVVHIVIINIFGTLNGNIILPTVPNASSCADCGMSAIVTNNATVNNSVNSQAVSGDNTVALDSSGSATITTGNAGSLVNVDNVVNTNYLGVLFQHLFVNDFGAWNGSFMG
ncbi:MAG: hypothetical protein KGL95_06320, partial [Patescibacteria group bacterium]|nr:hypothetical protein [Patescibacteria group bacterium]